jgi:hypothetical protein
MLPIIYQIITLFLGGETIAWGVKEGAERTSKLVSKQAERYRTKETLDAANSANISPAVRHSIHYVYRGSKVAVKVTRYLRKFITLTTTLINTFS